MADAWLLSICLGTAVHLIVLSGFRHCQKSHVRDSAVFEAGNEQKSKESWCEKAKANKFAILTLDAIFNSSLQTVDLESTKQE